MIDDEWTHRARRVDGLGPGGPTARRVATPRVEPRRAAIGEPFEHDSRTASGGDGRPAGGSPGVRPRTRGSCSTILAAQERGLGRDPEAGLAEALGKPSRTAETAKASRNVRIRRSVSGTLTTPTE